MSELITKVVWPPEGKKILPYLWSLWLSKRMRTQHFVQQVFNHIPVATYPFGEDAYRESHKKHGWSKVPSPHNTWRSVIHFIQGLLMSLVPAYFLPFWAPVLGMLLFAGFLEYLDVKRGNGKIVLKNVTDVLDRTMGAAAGSLLCL